jgi:hypothetical protein
MVSNSRLDIDRTIVTELQEGGRTSVREVARSLAILVKPRPTAYRSRKSVPRGGWLSFCDPANSETELI